MSGKSKLGVLGRSGRRPTPPDPDMQAAQFALDSGVTPAAPTMAAPAEDAPPEAWALYCNEARGRAAAAVVEWGQRIAAAHAAYSAQPQRWGRTWEDWCQENLGIGRHTANRLRAIGENLVHSVHQILPTDQQALYSLARLRQQSPDAFEQAMQTGTITPQLTRNQAQALLKAAQGIPGLPTAAAAPVAVRRLTGITLEVDQAEKLEAIAAARGQTAAQVVIELVQAWLKRQPMPEGSITLDTTATSD